MPYYLLKLKLRSGSETKYIQGVKEMAEDIDKAGQILRYRAEKHYGTALIEMKVYGLEKNSAEVKRFLHRRAGHQPGELPDHNEPIKPRSSGPGKYRGKEEARDKPFNKM